MTIESNKYLTFTLSDEVYGISIIKVKEIIGIMTITNVPGMPGYVKGVINLRGKIIPVIDLRLKFSFEEREYDDRTCIIVIEMNSESGEKLSGFVVDSVSEVLDIGSESIEEPPGYRKQGTQSYIKGMGKVGEKVVMLLESELMLSEDVLEKITS